MRAFLFKIKLTAYRNATKYFASTICGKAVVQPYSFSICTKSAYWLIFKHDTFTINLMVASSSQNQL
jgi:hypothetical protein